MVVPLQVCGTLAGNEAGGKESEERGIAFAAKLAFFDCSIVGDELEVGIPSPTDIHLYPFGYRVGKKVSYYSLPRDQLCVAVYIYCILQH